MPCRRYTVCPPARPPFTATSLPPPVGDRRYIYNRQMLVGASRLHDRLFDRVIRAPMAFFDVTPSGEVLTRFSRDLDEIDTRLPDLVDKFGAATRHDFQAISDAFFSPRRSLAWS